MQCVELQWFRKVIHLKNYYFAKMYKQLYKKTMYMYTASLSQCYIPHVITGAPSDYTALSNVVVGPFNATNSEACFAISIMEDGVCEGEVGSDGVPAVEVFNAVVRSEEGSGVEVIASGSIASITIEDSAICSTPFTHSRHDILSFLYQLHISIAMCYTHTFSI